MKVSLIGKVSPRSEELKKKVEMAVRQQLSQHVQNEDSKVLAGIQRFLIVVQIPPVTIDRVLHEAAVAINQIFYFKEVAIGLRSETDGRYRYEKCLGFSKKVEEALRKLSYSLDEFFSQRDYPAIRLSKFTEICIVEEQPFIESEKDTYNRPHLLGETRNSPDDFVEGDYLDISLHNDDDEMIAWIELSMPMNRKMPSIQTIQRLELFASILSILIQKTILTKK